jgi:cytochrome b
MKSSKKVVVWDRFVRVFHWSLVTSFVVAYCSTESINWVHKGFGYAALALIAGHARFSDFVPTPGKLIRYIAAVLRGREPRYLGHNPAGAVMILFLLCMVIGIGVSGWMMTLDAFWGNGTVENTHVLLVDLTVVAVVLHVCAAIYESLRHRENLILSMITGTKSADGISLHESQVPPLSQGASESPKKKGISVQHRAPS